MKLGDFIDKNTKVWVILTKLDKFWLFLRKTEFSKNRAGAHFFFKLGSWNLIWGYLYIVSKNLWNRFLNFWFFWKLLIMSKILDILSKIVNTGQVNITDGFMVLFTERRNLTVSKIYWVLKVCCQKTFL